MTANRHARQALDWALKGDPVVRALLAIYCQLRSMEEDTLILSDEILRLRGAISYQVLSR